MKKTLEFNDRLLPKAVKKIVNEGKDFSANTLAVLPIFFFLLFVSFYASIFYLQFTFIQIFSISALFFTLLISLNLVFMPWLFKSKLKFDSKNLLHSLLVALFLVAFINSPSEQFLHYYQTFPLLEAELGLGWNADSVFHASIINSFNTLGFPSIAQNDTPFMVYHTLSHFIDSIIVRISGVDTWESYGLFYLFKSALLLSAIIIFISTVCKEKKYYVFILSLIFLIPIVVGTWHAVGSHGLWFTSLIIILSSPTVFRILLKDRTITFTDYLVLFVLLVTVSLGKVSSGFSYALLVGFTILLADYKNYRTYIFGLLLLVFFYIYNSLITDTGSELSFSNFKQLKYILLLRTNIGHDQLYQLYVLISITGILSFLFRSKIARRLFLGSIASTLSLITVIVINPNFSSSDIWYFLYGLTSVLMLLVYQCIVYLFSEKKAIDIDGVIYFNHIYTKAFLITILLLSTSQLSQPNLSIFHLNLGSIKETAWNLYHQPHANINGYGEGKENIAKQIKNADSSLSVVPRPLKGFRDDLHKYMLEVNQNKNNTLLYIPKDIFQKDFLQFKGKPWARGMLIYAVTGVPLIHGIESLRNTYGYADYDESAIWLERNFFDEKRACRFGKNIIKVENFTKPKFSLVKCNS